MKPLSSLEIRQKFLEYFEKHDHLKIKASSVVPQNDPTLLFINSGMAPLKSYFLGKEQPPLPRLCNFQPCIRTKDIDDVGDRHHLTIFEMMGSWSIGDYYKDRACELAYGLLVNELGFDPKKLYMTVYGGNVALGIPADTQSIEAWKKCGVPEDHIVVLGDDNFWGPAGETGPCGPCTEVFYDTGAEYGPEYKPGEHFDDESRYIEIWNAGVFMELNKQKDGSFDSLPLKSVDTGSGLERLAMVMNGCDSVYETDLMQPIMELSRKLLTSGGQETNMQKVRMLTDHMRAATFILGEGVAPSNEGQGYIPRRLIRKSVAALISNKVEKIDFTPAIEKVLSLIGDFYPQLRAAKENIIYNMNKEINEFVPIVKNGLERIEVELSTNSSSAKLFPGQVAFELVTTHGLPLEVLKSYLEEKNIKLDEDEYNVCYNKHKSVSRVISRKGGADEDQLADILSQYADTVFTGYQSTQGDAKVMALICEGKSVASAETGSEVLIVTDSTPFYGESGGQVGDCGTATTASAKLEITDTMKVKNIHVHVAKILSGNISKSDSINLNVEVETRNSIRRNHSATHLLHSALHQVVGKHAVQKGSLVKTDRLRFDFQHHQAVTRDELDEVERMVNSWISENNNGETDLVDYEEALEKGAMALFGEKYDSKVRVVSLGSNSVELCGGTHVKATGDIGLFLIASESSVAKGIRRIEAVTGAEAIKLMQERNDYLRKTADILSAKPKDFEDKIKELKKKSSEKKKEKKNVALGETKFSKEVTLELEGAKFFLGQVDTDAEAIKQLGDQMIDKGDYQMACIVGVDDGTMRAFAWVEKSRSKKIKAGDLLKKVLAPVGGKGGGKPHFAQGGVPKADKVDKVFSNANTDLSSWLNDQLS
jgi:alanyl-tRNA synthetase